MNRAITCTINGKSKDLTIDVRKSLLEVLRDNGLTSVKQGCGVGECGACTVLINDEPIDSCIYLAVWADGKSIRTVEGELNDGQLSQIQEAYVDEGAVQCGFCTPGFIMTSTAFVEKNKDRKISRDDIRAGHAGNLCRCTGYQTIIDAVEKSLDLEE
ncbi:xanthine dehydrogenase subunit XdhC [Thermodesulfobacteriota bacterium]